MGTEKTGATKTEPSAMSLDCWKALGCDETSHVQCENE